MSVSTYTGTLRDGKVEISEPVDLPDGCQVYVIVPSVLDERSARRKANGWLISDVGNMLMAQNGTLHREEDRLVWRFDVMVTSAAREPQGPIGQLRLDAADGHVFDQEASRQRLVGDAFHSAQ